MRAVAAGRDNDVGIFIARAAGQLDQVLRANAFLDSQLGSCPAQHIERAGQPAAGPSAACGRVEEDRKSHGMAWEGCGIGILKSSHRPDKVWATRGSILILAGLGLFVSCQKLVSRNAYLGAHSPQSRGFKFGVIRHGQGTSAAVRILADH